MFYTYFENYLKVFQYLLDILNQKSIYLLKITDVAMQ